VGAIMSPHAPRRLVSIGAEAVGDGGKK